MEKSFIKNEKEFKKINTFLKKALNIISDGDDDAITEIFNGSNKICKIMDGNLNVFSSKELSDALGLHTNIFLIANANAQDGKYFFEQKEHKKWTSEQRLFYFSMVCLLFKDEYVKEVFNLDKPMRDELFTSKDGIIKKLMEDSSLAMIFCAIASSRKQFLDFMLTNLPKDIKYEYLFQVQGRSFLIIFLTVVEHMTKVF